MGRKGFKVQVACAPPTSLRPLLCQRDPWPKPADQRPARCTGAALSVSLSLLERTVGKQGARVMLFMGGPCDVGPGAVVNRPLKETLRSTSDLIKVGGRLCDHVGDGRGNETHHSPPPNHLWQGNAPLFKPACEFYRGLADRARASGHCVDVFACCLDQVGLLELKSCVSTTGGLCVLADSFDQSVFKESFRYIFRRFDDAVPGPDAGQLQMGFGATLEVLTSRDYKISGALGPVCR